MSAQPQGPSGRRMDFGVVFPTTQIGTDPAVIRDFAQTAEGLAYPAASSTASTAPAWAASAGSILSIRTMSTGARYHGVPDVEVGGPAAHLAALGEFLRVLRA